ncbi:MAG TPA: hypothetical protein VFE53_03925 [Mucilaginibacter sp.]|jgi:hypothetical protein|nr:hypothetical protein [Mucilaginibacter sp.]
MKLIARRFFGFKCVILVAVFMALASVKVSGQIPSHILAGNWNYDDLYKINGIDSSEVSWLKRNIPDEEARQIINLVLKFSRPCVSQLLPAYSIYDGSFKGQVISDGLIDSLYERPADAEPGVVHVAFLH